MKKSDFIVIGAVGVIVGILLVCLYVFGGESGKYVQVESNGSVIDTLVCRIGNMICENQDSQFGSVEQYTDKASGKQYPSILDYTFKQDDTFVDTRYLKMNIF